MSNVSDNPNIWKPTMDLRINSGVIQQRFERGAPGQEVSEWRNIPDPSNTQLTTTSGGWANA